MATKSDLRNDVNVQERLRERGYSPITIKQGKNLAKSIGAAFIEVDNNVSPSDFSGILSVGHKNKKSGKNNTCVIV